jgi:hypothetical protein
VFDEWEMEDVDPESPRLRYTTFEETAGMPIVHSRKLSNYSVNLKKIFMSSELHETAFDLVEDALSVPRLLYRIARFSVTQSKISLSNVESAIYFLLWKDELCPVVSSEGYSILSDKLKQGFGEKIDHTRFQASLDSLVQNGLISITEDVVEIVEKPWPSAR